MRIQKKSSKKKKLTKIGLRKGAAKEMLVKTHRKEKGVGKYGEAKKNHLLTNLNMKDQDTINRDLGHQMIAKGIGIKDLEIMTGMIGIKIEETVSVIVKRTVVVIETVIEIVIEKETETVIIIGTKEEKAKIVENIQS